MLQSIPNHVKPTACKWLWVTAAIMAVFVSHWAMAQEGIRHDRYITVGNLPPGITDTVTIGAAIDSTHKAEKSNPDSAIDIYRQTLVQSRKMNYTHGLVMSLIYMGNIYSEQGKYDSALLFFNEAVNLCLAAPSHRCYLPEIYNSMACVYDYRSNYGEAVRYLFKASFDGHKPSPGFSVGGIFNNMASILSKVGRPQQALSYLDKAETYAKSNKKQELLLGGVLLNKATIYVDARKWDSGIDYLQRSLAIAEANNIVVLKKIANINLGNVYMVNGDSKKALTYFLQAKELKGKINPIYENAGNAMLGGCYCTLGKYSLGFPLLLAALQQAKELKLTQNIANINRLLSECYTIQKDYKKALEYNLAFSHIKDSMAAVGRTQAVNQYEVRYRTAEKSKALAEKELFIIKQNSYLKKKNLLITGMCGLALLLGIATVSVYRMYKHRQLMQEKQILILQQEQKIGQFKAVMEGEEKERSRIARELHDGLGGMMAATKMNFSTLQNQYEVYSKDNAFIKIEEFGEIQDMLDDVNNELRRTAYNLMPDILSMHGIAEALRMYIEPINAHNQLYINLQINGTVAMDSFFELSLYRIIQELIQNIIKHSGATNSLVQLNFGPSDVSLLVKDNGRGFNTTKASSGLGLQNVQFRVHSFKGTMTTTSSESTGTSVLIQFDDIKYTGNNG